MTEKKKEKGRQWDGVSRPSDDLYRKNFEEIFGKYPKDSGVDDTLNTSQNNNVRRENEEKQKSKKATINQ